MKVKEFCKILELEECGVDKIKIREYCKGKVVVRYLSDAELNCGNHWDEYDTVVEWFLAEYGDCEIMEGAYIYDGSFRCELRKE